ncbi:MAG: phenylacetate--CoA ligase family protein [Actinobacteria bacterium]|nr:phenylacetate--CoA ligase family protein [Actinomycetota bacterium]
MDLVPLTPLEPWIVAKIGRTNTGTSPVNELVDGAALSVEALHAYQLARLNETLALAQRKSAHYRRTLGADSIRLSALDELYELPFTTSDDLREAPLDFVCVRHSDVDRVVTLPTSGTTGRPKRIFFTAPDQELTRDFFHHGMSTIVGPGDRVLILLPGHLPGSVGDLLKAGLERLGVEGIPYGLVQDPAHALGVMAAERVSALLGVPVQVLGMAKTALAEGRTQFESLTSVLLSTDRVSPAAAKVIESAWGCRAYNHYGSTEMGLGGGVDCRARVGYHMREADLLFEIVDPVTGRPVPDGVSGEVVFTTLTRRAMPLVRYRTGDVSRFIPGTCACGTKLKTMAHVDSRLSGGCDLPGGGVLRQRDLDEALLPLDGLADFKASLERGGERETLVLGIKWCGDVSRPDEGEILRALRGIPALSDRAAREKVAIDVREWDVGQEIVLGTGKRKIDQSWQTEHGGRQADEL